MLHWKSALIIFTKLVAARSGLAQSADLQTASPGAIGDDSKVFMVHSIREYTSDNKQNSEKEYTSDVNQNSEDRRHNRH